MDEPLQTQLHEAPAAAPEGLIATALAVVSKPAAFFRAMPKTGGFTKPLLFAVAMGVIAGLIQSAFFAVGFKPGAGLVMAAAALVLTPLMVAVFGFIGAGLAWITWKLMGSQESYETAYRCSAYASAVTPLTAVAGLVPVVGPSLGMIWMTFLVIVSSVEVHKIDKRRAQLVFGGMCAFFVAVSIAGQLASRALRGRISEAMASNPQAMEEMAQQLAGAQGMTPEQQKALAAIMAQLQQAGAPESK